jgi:hypothetical protein
MGEGARLRKRSVLLIALAMMNFLGGMMLAVRLG